MNVIGEIGNFIIKYQEPIQAVVIVAATIGVIVIIAGMCIHARKKRELLSQIQETVEEINVAVNQMNEKKTDVIYIDHRVAQPEEYVCKEAPVAETEPEEEPGSEPLMEAEAAEEVPAEPEVAAEETKEETAEETAEPVLKYFSRDCAVSKTGRVFTLEELDAQIRE